MTTLLLVGCGKMGSALLARWARACPAGIKHFAIIEPSPHTSSGDVRFFTALEKIPDAFRPELVVFAIKPQQMEEALPAYAKRFGVAPLYLSIAAGKSLAYLAAHLGKDAAIIRVMTNTPALIGEAITALCATGHVTSKQKMSAEALMQAVGKTLWVEEQYMDAVTAISGSGPAYVFLLMEALTKAAVASGLDEKTATELVRQTVKGSALLAETSDFSTLRKQVTSPGGTTEAALRVLQEKGFEALLREAVQAAAQRAQELNKI
jgi:pyrroline-5-carboxylate reductase